jgi:iron complex transport system ATP-binding protein
VPSLSPSTDTDPVLVVRHLEVELASKCVLQDLSLELFPGEVVALVGPNGAGKTTLLRATSGLCPYTGQIAISGRDLRELAPHERAQAIAYVPQVSSLDAPMLVWDVVAQARYSRSGLPFALGPADKQAIELSLARVHVGSLAERPFTELSGGEQRRVLLARALATGARVVLLDEPTASLDIRQALLLTELLRELCEQGFAFLAALHHLEEVERVASRWLLLEAGRLVSQGSAKELAAQAELERVLGVQLVRAGGLGYRLPPTGSEG